MLNKALLETGYDFRKGLTITLLRRLKNEKIIPANRGNFFNC